MNIYFYDISKNKHILDNKVFKNGTVVITKDNHSYSLSVQKINTLTLIATNVAAEDYPSTKDCNCIFSFDPVAGRKGNTEFLKFLSSVFNDKIFKDFFDDAYKILSYKSDSWNADILSGLYGYEVPSSSISAKEPTTQSHPLKIVPAPKSSISKESENKSQKINANVFNRLDDWRKEEAKKLNIIVLSVFKQVPFFS